MAVRAEAYVTTHSLYAAIYDEFSPANVKGFVERELEAGRQEIRDARRDEILTLFAFNGRLMSCAARGELLAWTLFLDGVFRAVVEVGAPLGPDASPSTLIDNLGGPLTADLVFPTGRLVVGCLSRLGLPQAPAATVEPGTYRVHFTRDYEEEDRHTLLQSRSDYPPGEGPDWKVAINRIQP
jgi:hypothetical protein